jgi:hypothetical protein
MRLSVSVSSAVLVEGDRSMDITLDENCTGGFGDLVPDMMPPGLLAALRYTTPVQSIVHLGRVIFCA